VWTWIRCSLPASRSSAPTCQQLPSATTVALGTESRHRWARAADDGADDGGEAVRIVFTNLHFTTQCTNLRFVHFGVVRTTAVRAAGEPDTGTRRTGWMWSRGSTRISWTSARSRALRAATEPLAMTSRMRAPSAVSSSPVGAVSRVVSRRWMSGSRLGLQGRPVRGAVTVLVEPSCDGGGAEPFAGVEVEDDRDERCVLVGKEPAQGNEVRNGLLRSHPGQHPFRIELLDCPV
jgi:hypothetical protein